MVLLFPSASVKDILSSAFQKATDLSVPMHVPHHGATSHRTGFSVSKSEIACMEHDTPLVAWEWLGNYRRRPRYRLLGNIGNRPRGH